DPAAVLMCGGGWFFDGDLAWLNEQVFPADPRQVLTTLSAASPEVPFLAPKPGQTLRMVGGKLARVEEQVPFLRALPQSAWPSRPWHPPVATAPDFGPATGRKGFDDAHLDELHRELSEFAASLYGGMLFRALYSLRPTDLEGKRPTVVLALR